MKKEKSPAHRRAITLEQSLQDTRELLHLRIKEVKRLKNENTFIHSIYRSRSGSTIYYLVDEYLRTIILSSIYDSDQPNIVMFLPGENKQIARIDVSADSQSLILTSLDVDFTYCGVRVGEFMLKELISRAKVKGLSIIKGHLFVPQDQHFPDIEQFYQLIGFQVDGGSIMEDTYCLTYCIT